MARHYDKIDLPVSEIRLYLESGPIVLVTSACDPCHSSSDFDPFAWLQVLHAVVTFSKPFEPPRHKGTTWSPCKYRTAPQ
jgi:hypothetical protein